MAATKGTVLAVITAMKVVHEDLGTHKFVAGSMTIGGEEVVCVIARGDIAKDLRLLVESRQGNVHTVSDEIQAWLGKS